MFYHAGGKVISSFKVLVTWQEQECEAARDKVFGMLGLVSVWDPKQGPMSADYTKSVPQLFRDVLLQVKSNFAYESVDARMGFIMSLHRLLRLSSIHMQEYERRD